MIDKILWYVKRLRQEQKPVKFIISRLLWFSNMCRLLKIDRGGIYTIRFHPTYLSARLWVYPERFDFEESLIRQYLRPGDTYIDVGANIGTTTLSAASVVGENGSVVAIEPHPRISQYLTDNVNQNQPSNISIYPLAVGDAKGEIHFSNDTSDVRNHVVRMGAIVVEVDLLDNVLRPHHFTCINLMKIDVEGYEIFVLKGAVETLQQVETLFLECAGHERRYGYEDKDLRTLLRSQGFRVFRIMHNPNNIIASRSIDQLRDRLPDLPVEEFDE